jgi:hypothetical protein
MRVLLDECLPRGLKKRLSEHEVKTVLYMTAQKGRGPDEVATIHVMNDNHSQHEYP